MRGSVVVLVVAVLLFLELLIVGRVHAVPVPGRACEQPSLKYAVGRLRFEGRLILLVSE